MKKSIWPYMLLMLLVVGCALLIFFFSSQGSEASNQSSEGLVRAVISFFYPDYSLLSKEDQDSTYRHVYFLVRKTAHFLEFALLGYALRSLLNFHRIRFRTLLSWALGTFYAGTDELHQYFLGDRTASIRDVCIDSAGVLFGCFLAALFFSLYSRYRRKKA